jgi:hypothetical protein
MLRRSKTFRPTAGNGHFETKSGAPPLPSVGPILMHELTFCTLLSS